MKHIVITLIIFLVAVMMGCKNNATDAGLTGKIIGFVQAFNDHGNLVDPSGVKVELEVTSIASLSNSSGRWQLDVVKAGTYTLVFSKLGYGTAKFLSIQFVGGGDLYLDPNVFQTYFAIAQLPTSTVASLNVQIPDTSSVRLNGTLSDTTTWERSVIVFYGKTTLTSSNPATYIGYVFGSVAPNSNTFQINFAKSAFVSQGIAVGETAYVAVYTHSLIQIPYPDPATGRYWYPSISNTRVAANFVVP